MEPERSLPHSQVPATCRYPEPARSSPCLHIFWRSILILSSHLRLSLRNGLFPLRFPYQNSVYTSLFPIRATCPAHNILDLIIRRIFGEKYRSLSSSFCYFFPPLSFYLVPLRPKYSSQHAVLRHPQRTLRNISHVLYHVSSWCYEVRGPCFRWRMVKCRCGTSNKKSVTGESVR